MSIVKTITNEYEFAEWIKQSDSYSNNFSLEGAKAVQAWYDENSYELDDTHIVEFDPIAWCCEWSEYKTALEFCRDHWGENDVKGNKQPFDSEENALEYIKEHTTILEFDGGIAVREF